MKKAFSWKRGTPEREGMRQSSLGKLQENLIRRGTRAFLVIRHDRIVLEWYAPEELPSWYDAGYGPKRRHFTASLAKVLVGAMSLLIALDDDRLALDDPAWKYIPAWKEHPEKSRITIRHLATHSSGIEDANEQEVEHHQLAGWKGDFWKMIPDPFTIARDKAPVLFPPGSKYDYSNPGMAMLAYAVTAALKNADQSDIKTLLHERIMKPIGIEDEEWTIGYSKAFKVDGLRLYDNWGGAGFTPRATARVGRLMLHKGNWERTQLLSRTWAEKAVSYAGTPLPPRDLGNPKPALGICWYVNFDAVWPSVPRDAFAGYGAQDQILLVVPSLDLIVVRNGGRLDQQKDGMKPLYWIDVEKYLLNPLMDSIVG